MEMFGRYPMATVADTWIAMARHCKNTDAQIIELAARRAKDEHRAKHRRIYEAVLARMQKGNA